MDITRTPMFRLNEERAAIVAEVIAREMADKGKSEASIELAINDAAYHEIARLEGSKRGSAQLEEWTELYRSLGKRSPEEKEKLLRDLLQRHAWDIVGNFDPKVYNLATSLVPKGLERLFKTQLQTTPGGLMDRVTIQGHVEPFRSLCQKGTVILVPTHSSNLDSIVVGFALHQLGLPPFTYGAGKNLFSNFLISYFMNNLGAYKVDRRLRHRAYLDALKTYSTVILERGYHSLFFPGGGRARSGAIERKLKLGLLGTGFNAYINNLRAGKENPNFYVVPLTLNYPLVLEAATLIDDHLKITGKSRYIIEDDEFSKLGRLLSYSRAVLDFDTRTFLHFGQPMDLFGNRVDAEGRSFDSRGRLVDCRKYVEIGGEPHHDANRDAEYTRELGVAIGDAFMRNNVALTTHVVAFTLFELLRQRHRKLDLYHLIRLPADTAFPVEMVREAIARLRDRLIIEVAAGRIFLSPTIQGEGPERILEVALRYFQMYHLKPLATQVGDQVLLNDIKLLLFYHNRLTGYGLEKVFEQEIIAQPGEEWANV